MKSTPRVLVVFSLLVLAACNPNMRFSELGLNGKAEVELPSIDPKVPETPVVEPTYVRKSGACAADSSTSVTSCMKCTVPVAPPEEPPMSLKARQLMASMTAACQVYNRSYGSPYTAPVQADHFAKLNRCSALLYKDSAASSGQSSTVSRLVAADSSLVNKMFTGTWHQPPYSDHFKTYFGIEVYDAARIFCQQNTSVFPGFVYPADYVDQINRDPFGYKLPQEYVLANQYREGLKTCLAESMRNPWTPGPGVPQKSCSFETLSGEFGPTLTTQVSQWISLGRKVAAEVKNVGLCLELHNLEDLLRYNGEITVGTYVCN